jgi:hypothetical protein
VVTGEVPTGVAAHSIGHRAGASLAETVSGAPARAGRQDPRWPVAFDGFHYRGTALILLRMGTAQTRVLSRQFRQPKTVRRQPPLNEVGYAEQQSPPRGRLHVPGRKRRRRQAEPPGTQSDVHV